jgi:hypothetical protein
MNSLSFPTVTLALLIASVSAARAEMPEIIAAPGQKLVATIHAQGAQVYECRIEAASGRFVWQFREPIATLFIGGETVGRHYAGPSWELADGSMVTAKVATRAPGANPTDIPLLKLEVTAYRGKGQLTDIATIQRLNTNGGVAYGPCPTAGAFRSVPYSADYAFYTNSTKPDPAHWDSQSAFPGNEQ